MTDDDLKSRAKTAEQALCILEARERRVRAALKAARVYLWDWDVIADRIDWSGELEQNLHLKGVPKTIAEFKKLVHPDDLPLVNERLSSALFGSASEYSVEFRHIRPDGQIRWVGCRAIVIRDDDGKAVRLVGCERDISVRKFNELALIESEAKLRTAYTSLAAAEFATQTGTWDWDIARDRIYVSDSYRLLYGLSENSLVTYESWLGCVHPADRAHAEAYGKAFLAGGTRYDFEFRIIHPIKGIRWLAAIGGLTRGDDGSPVRFTGINIDVTERRSFDVGREHLRDLREMPLNSWPTDEQIGRAAAIVASTPDAIITLSGDEGYVTTWNLGAERLFGYTEAEALHKSVADLILPDSVPEGPGGVCAIALKRRFAHEDTFRRHKDGTLIAVSATAARMNAADGRIMGVSVVFRDARQRLQNEARLRESEHRLQLAIDAGKLGPWEVDLSNGTVWLHKNTAQMHGFGDQEVATTIDQFLEKVHPQDRDKLLANRHAITDGKPPVRIDFRVQKPDGDLRWISSTPSLVRDELGNAIKLTGVHEDVTARVANERALRLSEARLRLGVEISHIGLGDVDYLQNTISLDATAAAIFELSPFMPLARDDIHARFHAEDREHLKSQISQLLGPSGDGNMMCEHRIVLPDAGIKWIQVSKQVFYDDAATACKQAVSGLLAVVDITDRKSSEEKVRLLMGELAHRSRNLLSLIQAVARQTFGGARTSEKARIFDERLMSIAACQNLLINSDWKHVDFLTLVQSQLSHFEVNSSPCIHISGPDLKINCNAAQAIGMAIHELATNSVKYGALSTVSGTVSFEWSISSGETAANLYCRWKESGGPEVKAPTRRGFGQSVLVKAPVSALGASVWLDYPPDGVVWELCVPMASVRDP